MTPAALFGWAVIAIALSIFADIESTSEVAVAFAWLILIAVLFNYGVKLFDGISAIVGGTT